MSDVLAEVLAAARVSTAVSARSELSGTWGLRFGADHRHLGFHVVVEGACWLLLDGAAPVALHEGDVVLLPTGDTHVLADHPTSPVVDFGAGGAPTPGPSTTDATDAADDDAAAAADRTILLCGAYGFGSDAPSPVLRGLPPLLHLPAADAERHPELRGAVVLLANEVHHPSPGSPVVIDRLVDLLLVYVLRAWMDGAARAGCERADLTGSWLEALADPAVGAALGAIHDDPAHPWTVATLADRAAMSRAAFARRFTSLVGEPPLTYLTRWRMTAAATLLRDSDLPLGAVARAVGYRSEFAFAKAFKRHRGAAPGRYRAAGRAADVSVAV